MALYDGFFDAEKIKNEFGEETEDYDRTYDSADFTGYFASFVGSGVCVHENPSSFQVRLEDGSAVIAPGYLFIRGYWLKNDADYILELPAEATAVAAHLNLGRRMIELIPANLAQPSEDTLILAVIGTSGAEDTRYNAALCGVIDSAGSLTSKVEYAIHYIETEIEDKLAAAKVEIAAQAARLDNQIARVEALASAMAPPPVGTIKFSASQNMGEEWLRCDGSFVSETEYPELVEALGKLTPGAEDFWEAYEGEAGQGLSNGFLLDGTLWTYSAAEETLYGYHAETRQLKTVPVTGGGRLKASAANPICLSIAGGSLFLAQNFTSADTFVLLEGAGFTNGSQSLSLVERDITPAVNAFGTDFFGSLPGESFAPEVAACRYNWGTSASPSVRDSLVMCLGLKSRTASNVSTANKHYFYVAYLVWEPGSFSAAKIGFIEISEGVSSIEIVKKYIQTIFRFSRKNEGELLAQYINYFGSTGGQCTFQSFFSEIYSASDQTSYQSGTEPSDPISTSPAAGGNRYLYRCFLSDGRLNLRLGWYNPSKAFSLSSPVTAGVSLPSRARLFPDSVCYASAQELWLVFVGTGIAFSQTPEDEKSWGYLDTTETLGVITQAGCLEYDSDGNRLYLSGQDSAGRGKLGVMQFRDLYDYANDGAWLPLLASDGVPAYIKAYEPENGGDTPENALLVTVLESTTSGIANSAYYTTKINVIFNGTVLGAGEYSRVITEPDGTFTAGMRLIANASSNALATLYVNETPMASMNMNAAAGTAETVSLSLADYQKSGLKLQIRITSM